eukprot:1157489-Pelagomonas_calceolata.AAC.6
MSPVYTLPQSAVSLPHRRVRGKLVWVCGYGGFECSIHGVAWPELCCFELLHCVSYCGVPDVRGEQVGYLGQQARSDQDSIGAAGGHAEPDGLRCLHLFVRVTMLWMPRHVTDDGAVQLARPVTSNSAQRLASLCSQHLFM